MPGQLKKLIIWIVPALLGITASPAQQQVFDNEPGDTVTPQPHIPASYWQSMLPEGKNRDLVTKRCGFCHDFQRVIAFARPREQWEEVVAAVERRGVPGQPGECTAIVGD